ncbi:YfjI family protein [Candidatus Protochlamydia phocaeensis]|uniref:YfjI family protein n=1 Tax=Candidatus Protochlamydia phocaeensis TaxID=1414722 RepID=UPI0008398A76|nr:YfjI family protein [Candidatus Protochlamydia phocaeensis]
MSLANQTSIEQIDFCSQSNEISQLSIKEKSLERANQLEQMLQNQNLQDGNFPQANNHSPIPLQRDSIKQEAFPFESLGEILGKAAKALYEIIQAPDAICGLSVLGAAALATQTYADVEIDGRQFPLSLFLISIADSGERKSAVDKVALKPIYDWQKMLMKTYLEQCQKFTNNRDLWTLKRKEILANPSERESQLNTLEAEPTPPLKPIMIVEEPTYQGLVRLLDEGQPSIGLFSDEGGSMFGGWGMNSENMLNTCCGLSGLWDGKPISRIRTNESKFLYGRRFSLHLMIQPVVFDQVNSSKILSSQGLLARCLIAHPSSRAGSRSYREINPSLNPDICKYFERIQFILDQPIPVDKNSKVSNELNPKVIKLDQEAKLAWINFYNEIEKELHSNGIYHSIKPFASKVPEHVLRIACVITLIENIEAALIHIDCLNHAISLGKYFLNESINLQKLSTINPDVLLAEKTLQWMEDKYPDQIVPLPFIYQYGPNAIREAKKARSIMKILLEHNQVIIHRNVEVSGKNYKEAYSLKK